MFSPFFFFFFSDKHKLVCHNINTKKGDDDLISLGKKVKAHLKAIMKRGAHKLTIGKRIRLKSDEEDVNKQTQHKLSQFTRNGKHCSKHN